MNAFLWTFVAMVGLNLAAVLVTRFQTPITTGARIFSVIVDVCMGAWAVYLLGGAA